MAGIVFGDKTISYEEYIKQNEERHPWRVAIPSFKRSNTIVEKTLAYLQKSNVPSNLIDVFVANEDEFAIYASTLERNTYGRIIVGVEGMMDIRNFIQSFYDEGQLIVCMDDDIKEAYKIDQNGKKQAIEDLPKLFDYAFQLCKDVGSDYWGIYAASNTFFMSREISLGLRYLIGSFWGMRVTHDQRTYVTMHDKEDFERSVRAYIKCGSVVRLDFISVTSNYYGEKGGMQETRTEKRVTESGIRLMRMFPNQVVRNTARQKHFEVKLQENRERYKQLSKRKLTFL